MCRYGRRHVFVSYVLNYEAICRGFVQFRSHQYRAFDVDADVEHWTLVVTAKKQLPPVLGPLWRETQRLHVQEHSYVSNLVWANHTERNVRYQHAQRTRLLLLLFIRRLKTKHPRRAVGTLDDNLWRKATLAHIFLTFDKTRQLLLFINRELDMSDTIGRLSTNRVEWIGRGNWRFYYAYWPRTVTVITRIGNLQHLILISWTVKINRGDNEHWVS